MHRTTSKNKNSFTSSPVQKTKLKRITTTETSSPKITKPVKTKKTQPPKFTEKETSKLTRSDSFANVLKRKGSSFFGNLPEMTGRASLGILSPRRKQASTPFTSPTKNNTSMTSPREPKDKISFIKKLSSFKKGKENNTTTPNTNDKTPSKTSSKESFESEFDDEEDFKSPVKTLFTTPKGITALNLKKVKSIFGSTEEDFEDEFEDDEATIISIDSPKNDCLTEETTDDTKNEEDEEREAAISALKHSFSKKISNSFKYDDSEEDDEDDEIDGALIDEFGFNVPKNFMVKKNKSQIVIKKKQNLIDKLMSPRGNKNQ